MKKVLAAGGVVFRKGDHIEIAFIKDPYGKYAFAKGHIENGEGREQAAIREVKEEMGCLNIKLISYIGKMNYVFKDEFARDGEKAELIDKQVYYYLMELPKKQICIPQKDEGIEDVVWVDSNKAIDKVGYNNVKNILKKALKEIKKHTD